MGPKASSIFQCLISLKTLSAIIIFFNLISCSTKKPIPVAYHCPQIILPPDPIPLVKKLKPNAKPDEIIKAWVATAMAYRDWNKIVRKQIHDSK